ncbi:MAG: hypothetical protein AB7P18_19540, partial [Candidatus Binatia bacterium]
GVAFQSSSLMPSGGEMFAMLGSLPITNPQPPQPLAPPLCGYDLTAIDPLSHAVVPLFNPRRQSWTKHFILDGVRIVGLTSTGRAIVVLLKFNAPARLVH